MVRKNAVGKLPMKSVAKTATPEQLDLDFEGRVAARQKTGKSRTKAPRVRKAPASINIPEKPKG